MDEEYFDVHAGIDPDYELNYQDDEVTFIEIDEMYYIRKNKKGLLLPASYRKLRVQWQALFFRKTI